MHSILRQQAAQFVAVGGCGCHVSILLIVERMWDFVKGVKFEPKTHRPSGGL